MAADRRAEREAMCDLQLAARGIGDQRVLAAMRTVPRELFVRDAESADAYADRALPLPAGQTISQPWIVAAICEALAPQPHETVLEIGTGAGYSAAILAHLAGRVISIERIAELSAAAATNLENLERLGPAVRGSGEIELITGDGSVGLPERAPFPAIAVHATIPTEPHGLIEQLAPGGRLVAPVRTGTDPDGEPAEHLVRFRRGADGISRETIAACRFVPLIGEAGFGDGR